MKIGEVYEFILGDNKIGMVCYLCKMDRVLIFNINKCLWYMKICGGKVCELLLEKM